MRTAIGVGVLTFYIVLFVAGSQDIIAQRLTVSVPGVLWTLRVALVVLPPLCALLAYRLARDLHRTEDLDEEKDRIVEQARVERVLDRSM